MLNVEWQDGQVSSGFSGRLFWLVSSSHSQHFTQQTISMYTIHIR
ncbi:MAG: hypothetical protein ACRCUY_01955 [Thermoguttaceae bacterium]